MKHVVHIKLDIYFFINLTKPKSYTNLYKVYSTP